MCAASRPVASLLPCVRAIALLGGIVCALWLGSAQAVSAHAILLHTEPPDQCTALQSPRLPTRDPRCDTGVVLAGPPTAVQLWFSEAPQPIGEGITVTSPTGAHVATGPVRVEGARMRVPVTGIAPDATGTYIVTWEVIAADTHPERGSFAFSIGEPSVGIVSPDRSGDNPLTGGLAVASIARWLHFLGYALGFGPLAFVVFVLHPLSRAARHGTSGKDTQRQVRWLVQVGIALLLTAEPLALVGQLLSLGAGGGSAGANRQIVGDVLASSFGRVLAQRVGAAVLLWVLLGVLDATDADTRADTKATTETNSGGAGAVMRVALAVGIALAVADGEASHAGNNGGGVAWLGYLANTAHVASMGLWRSLDEIERAGTLHRFGRVAGGALVVLIVSGSVMAVLHLSRPADLFTSAYGRALVAKLMVLLDALLLAWAGWAGWAGTRIRRGNPVCRMRWWLLEGAVLTGVLIFAALLVSLPPLP